MGAPKKPMALRELHGTANRNKQRNNDDAPVPERGIGPPPEHLNVIERALWDEIVGISYPGVMGEADRTALEVMVRLMFRFRHASPGNGVFGLSAAEQGQLIGLFGRFGMTPSDREKVKAPQRKGPSKFGKFK